MPKKNTGPAAIFGIRIKSIVVGSMFLIALLAVINRDEFLALFNRNNFLEQTSQEQTGQNVPERDIVVDQKMLSDAVQQVQAEKLAELESRNSSIPTDRFFYIVELVSGGDLEGTDLTIEPDQVILISEGGTSTTINRADVKEIHRHKLPPSPKE